MVGSGAAAITNAVVSQLKAGDHVVLSWNPHCGHCFYCDRDAPILDHTIAALRADGATVIDGTDIDLSDASALVRCTFDTHIDFREGNGDEPRVIYRDKIAAVQGGV